ncbi:protein IWS1 homolog [Acanthaster planci]|uniref:Protein IWS1 homolog n=1 Tax=Acanthaster planci TaxID=133434 RepID=A0A8B7ZUA3_ACAPL|nr:protein IWS1 homolog [Acanthaster planci]
MADEQVGISEQDGLMGQPAEASSGSAMDAVNDNVQLDTEEEGTEADGAGVAVIQAEEKAMDGGENATASRQEDLACATEDIPTPEAEQSGETPRAHPLSEVANSDDSNDITSDQEKSDTQQDLDGNNYKSQSQNSSPSNEDANTSPLDQDTNASPSAQHGEDGSLNQVPESASLKQDSNIEPSLQESGPPGQQDLSNLHVSDPDSVEEIPEDNEAKNVQINSGEGDAKQSRLQEQDQVAEDATEVPEVGAEMSPDSDELREGKTLDYEITEEASNGLSGASANRDEEAKVAVGDTHDEAPSSQQPPVQDGATEDNAEIAADNPSAASSSPQSPVVSAGDDPPDPVHQENNNNELSGSKSFVNESVRIPTAEGDMEETGSNRGSQEDPAMYKMRSSLPADAYGDSKGNRLPALIHPDPRLAHSLPASMERGNIPNRYQYSRRAPQAYHGHIPRIPSASGSTKAEVREGDVRRALNSAKLPPSVMKMSTVMVSARKRAVLNRNASVFYEEMQHRKVISLDQAINSRPPMPFDLDGPGPWSYSPRNKPLNEDNSPEYTFGHRLNEKNGGGRTAYAKTWFNSNNGFTQKVNFERRWPSPAHYNSTRPLMGRHNPTLVDHPSFTIGVRSKFNISKRGSENEPAPNEYNRSKSDAAILRTAPKYTISHRHQGTKLWSGSELTPGPGAYNPRWGFSSGSVHHPSFTIQGVRRTKSHELGPHSTF